MVDKYLYEQVNVITRRHQIGFMTVAGYVLGQCIKSSNSKLREGKYEKMW